MEDVAEELRQHARAYEKVEQAIEAVELKIGESENLLDAMKPGDVGIPREDLRLASLRKDKEFLQKKEESLRKKEELLLQIRLAEVQAGGSVCVWFVVLEVDRVWASWVTPVVFPPSPPH